MAQTNARHNWKIILKHIENYTKLKYTIALLYDFLYRFKSHMYFHKNVMDLNKFEYISIIQNISHLQNELNSVKQYLQNKNIFIFMDTNKLSKIIEIYTSILYLIEKYGASNIINTMNYYLLLYCEIVELYHLYKKANPSLLAHKKNNKQLANQLHPQHQTIKSIVAADRTDIRLSSSLPNENMEYMAHNSKMAKIQSAITDKESTTDSSSTEDYSNDDELQFSMDMTSSIDSIHTNKRNRRSYADGISENEDEFKREIRIPTPIVMTNEKKCTASITSLTTAPHFGFDNPGFNMSLKPIIDMYNVWFLKVSKHKYINSFNTLNGTLLRNIYHPNRTVNNQYLDLMSNCIKPFEMNIFFKQDDNVYDLFECLSILETKEVIASKHLCKINHGISKIYKSIIQKLDNFRHQEEQSATESDSKSRPYNIQNINFSNILNTNILVNIKNCEYVKDNILHVFISIPITKSNKLIFVINGYIENQDITISQKYSITAHKYNIINKQILSIDDLGMTFKKMFLRTLTLKQLLCASNNDIIKSCYDKWTLYTSIMAMPVNDMITQFLNSNTRKKVDILSCLLYNYKNNEAIFRAQILWNLIIDESGVVKRDSIEREILNKLHPELMLYLNHMTSQEYNTVVDDGSTNSAASNEQMNYEKRIAQSNTDNITKQKMMEKLKEINNKSNDNNSKPQQYLDGLLNIPFGKIAKEAIICENDRYMASINQYISNLTILCLDYKDTYVACYDILEFIKTIIGLDIQQASSFTNEIDTETYIYGLLSGKKIKTGVLLKLQDLFDMLIKNKLLISVDTIDTFYLQTFLTELNDDEQDDICHLYNMKCIHDTASRKMTMETIIGNLENDIGLRRDIIGILMNESYFYDTGIPVELIRYKDKLMGLFSKNKDLIKKKKDYLENCYKQLDKSIYGQPDAKDQIIRIMGQWLNGNQSGYCIGFEGAPGVGKTSLAKYGIANALVDSNGKTRPFGFIALGGSANGSTLEGHGYTYVGSTWGRIADILMTSGVMNPIIFIDELDKISNTESGREILGILTHITDKTQNMEFMDKYFSGIKLDLSNVLFIFSYNDYSKLDSILADRIHRIKFDNYSINDKINICNNYLVPKIQEEINFIDFECMISNNTLRYIIESYTYEAGVRKLKEKIYDIMREINVKYIKGELDATCVDVSPENVDLILNSYYKVEIPKPMATHNVGVVYGLYATAMGTGGITIIQVTKKYTDSATLLCTGKPGDVMLESMKVSMTLAINILSPDILAKWGISHSGEANKFSLHIHCPDGATPKDGPSAGCAFTVGLFSLLTDKPVLNTVSMTGEIDILGNVLPIGGLDSKIQGSTRSGIHTVLVPYENKKDIDQIQRRQPEILTGVNIIFTKTIHDVLKHSLVG